MSEQKKSSFMEELDYWVETTVINPLANAMMEADDTVWANLVQNVKAGIRTKVLESYRNGQKAGPRPAKQPQKGGR
jgi:hypothetical protein